MRNEYYLTIDVDWAPDWMIDYLAEALIRKKVKNTWFVTHSSPAISRLQSQKDLFEIGLHPNCLPGSTQGGNEEEVLQYVRRLFPEAISMRTHALYQTTQFLTKASLQYGVKNDVSLFLPRTPYLKPHCLRWQRAELWRLPYFWEDDSEMFEKNPIWHLADHRLDVPGLKIFDFHPAYVVLNTNSFGLYEDLKKIKPLPTWSFDFVKPYINPGDGPQTLFLELIDFLADRDGGKLIREIIADFKKEEGLS